MLLVLDNCEHLLRECARLCQQLLRQSPGLHLLATSRSPLGIAGEQVLPVPTLSLPDNWGARLPRGHARAADYADYEAVRLFADRAAAARPGFELTDENAATVARICWRLDGIPHAIELAAARVRLLSLEQILERLDDRFRLLGRRAADVLPHQQTLRATMDWSFDMLSAGEKALLLRLSVFARGRSLEAIEAVCRGEPVEEWEILDLLSQLVDKSLISMEPDPAGQPRYFMLESLWEYTRGKLRDSGEMEAVRDRHLHYFMHWAETAEPHLQDAEQAKWLARIAEEHGNLRFAIERASESPEQGESGLRLLVALTRYWEVRSRLHEGREHFQTLLATPAGQGRHALRAAALGGAGRLAWCCDDDAASRVFYSEAIAIFRELGDERNAAMLTAFLGFVERNEDRLEAAEACFDDAASVADRLGDPRIAVVAISGRGSIAADRGDYLAARALKEEALEMFRELGDRWVHGLLSWSLARVCIGGGDLEIADRHLRELAGITRELGNRWIVPYVIEGFAQIALKLSRNERAAILFGASQMALTSLGLGVSPAERREHEADMVLLRERLEPATLDRLTAQGAEMSVEEAMSEALREE